MRINLFFLLVLFIVSCSSPQKPNVIIFFTDDQGYGDTGKYGAELFKTPQLDSLADSGMIFTDYYVPATVCTPSRAGLMTGRYPKRAGLHEAVLFPFSEHGLDTTEFTMAEYLKDKGYRTHMIGKWHLGHKEQYMPLKHGFDSFYGVPYSNDMDGHYYRHIDFQSPPLPFYENEKVIESGGDQRFLTKKYTEKAVEIIEDSEDNPFFIYLAHSMPHVPLHPSPDYAGSSELGIYGDVIQELDWSMGQIVQSLKRNGLFDNTILIFTSDNGPQNRKNAGSAGPLRGWKGQTWDGGQRVPFIISWPEMVKESITYSGYGSTMDIFPTLMEVLGDSPDDFSFDGKSILRLLKNPKHTLPDRPFIYYARNGQPEAIRMGNYKLRFAGFRDGLDPDTLLFNLDEDIAESEDLYESNPEKASELIELFQETTSKIQ